ncbi:helix-turn-helix transcriptional regulator [Clostridium sp. MD294]|uniref:helix-turn-helix domain-containing protein n=1 Tax=Clostridium sp. MD294 TaxID=97138 RepID=UPI0002C99715|nr:helix-turn-helix transcriptional regulator [Clostridium sp. MD294]NDO47837.1 helix-turn-helix transcriptional regulator [Clostridium sp. MD294]USF29840.1 hypothetical protein C820_001248 [Clostridium sp. MD294]
MVNIADKLKYLRKEKQLTQKELANICSIEETTIQRLEYGGKPSLDTVIKLADYFEVSVDYLIGRADN